MTSETTSPSTGAGSEVSFRTLPLRRIQPLIQAFAQQNGVTFSSCLDIGCGRSRYDRWFGSFAKADEPRRYIGLDTDPVIVDELLGAGVDIRNPAAGDTGDVVSDLTLCVEVVEHLLPEESIDFFSFVRDHTRKLLALTTPDFEYWRGGNWRIRPELSVCRWIPDHAPFFDPHGGPHAHKQRMTPDLVHHYLETTLPADEWDFEVFRAWPWRMIDRAGGEELEIAFKIYALAWRREWAPQERLELEHTGGANAEDASREQARADLLEAKLALAEAELYGISAHAQSLVSELAAVDSLQRRVAHLEERQVELEGVAAARGTELWQMTHTLEASELELCELRERQAEDERAVEELRARLAETQAHAAMLAGERTRLLEEGVQTRRDRDLALAGWGEAEQARARAHRVLKPSEADERT